MHNENHGAEKVQTDISKLQAQIAELRQEINSLTESPYLKKSIKHLKLSWTLDRHEIIENEFGQRINEKHGSMYDIKNQAHRYAQLLGIDPDIVRMGVTEGIQNALEHGHDRYAHIDIEISNDIENPHIAISFKHYMPYGKQYTLAEANTNAKKGDVSSEDFNFEDSRGRGEYIMKEVADERKLINGIETLADGSKKSYFKRVLRFFMDPENKPSGNNFLELKEEVDRLDYEDVIYCVHVNYSSQESHKITVASHKSRKDVVEKLMLANGYAHESSEVYYRTLFESFFKPKPAIQAELMPLFSSIRKFLYNESSAK